MLKILENNGTEEIGLVTPTPGHSMAESYGLMGWVGPVAVDLQAIAKEISMDSSYLKHYIWNIWLYLLSLTFQNVSPK